MVAFFKSQNVVPKQERFILRAPGLFRHLPHVYFRTKQIKGTPLLQLVEAYRNTEGQPRQRVVASLGGDTLPAGDPHLLAKAVEDEMNGQAGLLDGALTAESAAWVARVAKLAKRSKGATKAIGGTVLDGVLLDDMETEQVVELGPQLVAMKAWDALDFTPMLHNLGMSPAAIATAQLMVANRLIEPLSEWALIDWAGLTALPELLDVRFTKTTKDRLYRVGDEAARAPQGHRNHPARKIAGPLQPQPQRDPLRRDQHPLRGRLRQEPEGQTREKQTEAQRLPAGGRRHGLR